MTKFHQNFLALLTVQISIFRPVSLYWTVRYPWSFDSIHSHCHEDGIVFHLIPNSFHVMAVNKLPTLGVLFWGAYLPQKWGVVPPFSHNTTFSKGPCLLIKLKVLPGGLYGPNLKRYKPIPTYLMKWTVGKLAVIARIGAKFYPGGCYFSLNTKNI
jgi:hypothetical protein